ncbi:MAG: hypothetical protein EOO07_20600, partial [Chitinophagaceae bacterium]
MMMPGRKYSAANRYRYGFNGKENDNEIAGAGNQYDYGFRIYNSRIGRFLSQDPLTNKFPDLSSYQYSSNRPVDGIDIDGLEWKKYLKYAVSPVAVVVFDKKIKEGFVSRGAEFVHGIKSLPAIIEHYTNTLTSSIPGGAHVQQQEERRKNIEMAIGQGGIDYVAEMYQLIKDATIKRDKQALGALIFEAMVLAVPDAEVAKAFSGAGKFGKLLSADTKGMIKGVGKFEGAMREIAVTTKSGKRLDALSIAKELTGDVPADAIVKNGKQG